LFFVLNRSIIVVLKRVNILIKIQNKYMNFNFNSAPAINNSLENKYPKLNFVSMPEVLDLPPYEKTEIAKVLQGLNDKMFA
jgi:hypothetical protein